MKKIKWYLLTLVLVFSFMFAGCNTISGAGLEENIKSSDYIIYYTNQSKTELLPRPCEFSSDAEDTASMIDEMMEKVEEDPESVEYWKVLPETVYIESYNMSSGVLTLNFNDIYNDMSSEQEILCRGAISKDFLQIPGINCVRFQVEGKPLVDSAGKNVGLMTADTFLLNTVVEQDDMQESDLTLYFASKDGLSLVKEVQTTHYPASMSIEKVVMRRLLNGPLTENAAPSLPSGTNLISISVMDGVCLVNLDENFLVQDFNVSEKIVIYSIVNSLTALDSVDMVQISVNGDTNITYRESVSLSESFTENLEYVLN